MSDTAHSDFSPSRLPRLLRCPGSYKAEEGLPDKSSEYAREGTAAHALADKCFKEGCSPFECIGIEVEQVEVDADMAYHVQQYLDYCAELGGDVRMSENTLPLDTWLMEGEQGTADFIAVHFEAGAIDVVDLKYGKGKRVEAESNEQLMAYGLGTLSYLSHLISADEINEVRLHIYQPRIDHVDVWTTTVDELLAFAMRLPPLIEQALSDDPPRLPGEVQCQWCKAKGRCRALSEHIVDQLQAEFPDLTKPVHPFEPGSLSSEEFTNLLSQVDMIKNWCNALESHAIEQLRAGVPVGGYKLVEGRSTRKWKDEAAAKKALRKQFKLAEITKTKLVSPAEAEKLVGKKYFPEQYGALVDKPTGKPTLAKASDKRPALDSAALAGFDDLTADESDE